MRHETEHKGDESAVVVDFYGASNYTQASS